ncbi:MAG: hypothetical protein LBD77_11785, partial [Bifidobacteriaceae bacterium]|nr:hypothetical protein [Bifidobacteriaceae bacterium]
MRRNNDGARRQSRPPAEPAPQPAPPEPVFPSWRSDQPAAVITAAAPDRLTVKVYGVERELPDPSLGRRDQMGRLLDWLRDQIGGPFLAQITEADGTVATGWVTSDADTPPPAGSGPGGSPPAPSPDPAAWAQADPAPDPGEIPAPAWRAAPAAGAPGADRPGQHAATPPEPPGPVPPGAPSPPRPAPAADRAPRHAADPDARTGATAPPGGDPAGWEGWWRFNTVARAAGFIPGEEVVLGLAVAGEAANPDG